MASREVSRADVAQAYKQAFSTEDGQVVLADLMRMFSFTRRSTFSVTDPDPYTTIYREGCRSVLVHIGYMFDVDPAELEELDKTQLTEGEEHDDEYEYDEGL